MAALSQNWRAVLSLQTVFSKIFGCPRHDLQAFLFF
jgi:hypothetical protein